MNTEPWVYTGSWTNWSEGRVLGSRVTVSNEVATILIAFLAIFVRFAGQHFWSIFCYIYFRLHASNSNQDGLHREHQVLLRNIPNDTTAAWQFFRVGRAWHGRSPAAMRRSLKYVLYAGIQVIAFVTAGVSTSMVASTDSGVLLHGSTCGTWINPFAFNMYTEFTTDDLQARNRWQGWHVETVKSAATFSQQCYNTTEYTSSLANCKAFGPRLLDWTLSTNIVCPFDSKICANNTAVRFDSGLLDSQEHFGINSANDRVKYRTVLECAPIIQDGYRSGSLNASSGDILPLEEAGFSDIIAQEEFRQYFYGESWYWNTSATFTWNNLSFGMPTGNLEIARYLLDVENSVLGNLESGTFTAIPELNRTDADVVLFFLMSNTAYLNQVDDPWFQATRQRNITQQAVEAGGHPATITFHLQNNDASVMGCAQQHQFCNRDATRCSPLTGGAANTNTQAMHSFASTLNLTPRETAIQQRLYRAAWNNWVYQTSGYLEGSGLLAASVGSNDVSPSLPDNQWLLEVQSWFATGLTGIQMELANYVVGPKDGSARRYITPPDGADEEWMCSSQIVQRDGYTNLSGLGVGLILSVGGLIILIDLTLHSIMKRLASSRGGHGQVCVEAWDTMEALQLMRIAYQNNDTGDWQGRLGDVPVTGKGEAFGLPRAVQERNDHSVGSWTLNMHADTDQMSSSYSSTTSRQKREQEIKSGLIFSDTIEDDGVLR